MRSKTVTIGDKTITINEQKIKVLKNEIIPKLGPAWKQLMEKQTAELVGGAADFLADVFPELKGIDLDECYPSELEEFLNAWIDTNFFGLKRLLGPLMSFLTKGQQKPALDLAGLSASLTTGKH